MIERNEGKWNLRTKRKKKTYLRKKTEQGKEKKKISKGKKNSFSFRRMIKCNRSQITFQVQISSTSDRQLEAAILIKDERKLKLTSQNWSARYFESRYMYFVHKLREMNCQLHADQSTSRTSKRKRATKKWHSNARECDFFYFWQENFTAKNKRRTKECPFIAGPWKMPSIYIVICCNWSKI